jgi:hypothetical protein
MPFPDTAHPHPFLRYFDVVRRQYDPTVYFRHRTMNAKGVTLLGRSSNYYRKHTGVLAVIGALNRFQDFFRSIVEQVKPTEALHYCRVFPRTIAVTLRPLSHEGRNLLARRDIADHAGTGDSTVPQRGLIRTLLDKVAPRDYAGKVFTLFLTIREQACAWGEAGHIGDYLRGLYTEAGNVAETNRKTEYYREVQDTAGSMGVSLRHLFIFIRLVTLSLVRDYLLSRFLRAREELVLKSPGMKELELNSRIQ